MLLSMLLELEMSLKNNNKKQKKGRGGKNPRHFETSKREEAAWEEEIAFFVDGFLFPPLNASKATRQ